MRKLAVLTFMTLDGIMQAPSSPDEDPSENFTNGGWAADYWEPVMSQVMREAMAEPYDILFGRKTYELFANHWPGADNDNPVAKILNSAKKYVVTSTLTELNWQNSVAVTGDLIPEITRLKNQEGPPLQIHGSWQLIQLLLSHGLIDEFRLWTFPVAVGTGKRLFGPNTPLTRLEHIKTEPSGNGVVMNIYRQS